MVEAPVFATESKAYAARPVAFVEPLSMNPWSPCQVMLVKVVPARIGLTYVSARPRHERTVFVNTIVPGVFVT